MSEIDGPIIRFRIDAPQLQGAAQSAFGPVKQQARQTTAEIADDWKRMAAQIRGDMARGILTTKQEADAHRAVVSVLESKLRVMDRIDKMTTKQLADYKAVTLELERQKSFLKGTGGLTAGTHAAIGQFSTQTYLGITRAMDALVNRYFGGAAGSIFRTVRDLGYYGSIGAGGVAGERGAGLFSKLTSPAGLTALGGVGALTAAGVALGVMADKGAKLSVELTDLAHKTGLTTENAIRLRTAASVLGVDIGSLSVGFKRFSEEIVLANAGNKQAAGIFRALGVDIKRAATDPYSAIEQLAVEFAKMPDGALKVATATKLFGRGGQQLLPILSELATVEDLTKKSSQDLARALGTDVYDSTIRLRAEMKNWQNETEALEISLGKVLIPALVKTIGLINTLVTPSPTVQGGVEGYLRAQRMQLTPEGRKQLDLLLGPTGAGGREIDTNYALAHPEWTLRQLQRFSGESMSQLYEPFKDAARTAKKAAGDWNDLNSAVAGAAKTAKDMQAAFWKSVGEEMFRRGPARPEHIRAGEQIIGGRLLGGAALSRAIPAPGFGVGLEAQTGNLLSGIGLGAPGVGVNVPTTSEGILQVILGGDYNKIFNTREDQYRRELAQLKQALDEKLISYQDYNQAVLSIEDDLHQELLRKNREFNGEADRLFDQLITGDRNFGRTLVNDLRNAMLAPIRNMFDQVVGGILGGFSRGVQGGFSGTLGGIFGHGGLSRFATVPFLGGLIPGLGGKNAAPTGAAGDPVYVALAGNGPGGTGGILGGTGLGIGSNGLIGGILPLLGIGGGSGSGSSGGGNFLSKIFGGLFGGGKSGAAHGGFFGLGGKVGGGFAGLGEIGGGLLMGLGASTGGALGGLEGAAGGALSGALTGFTMGGPIGAAIGGIIGGIGGLITGIIGPSWDTRVQRAMRNQAYYAPPSETFSFASNGSIAQTLATGYSESGGRFGKFGLPSGTPFFASALTGPLSYRDYLLLQQENNQLNTGQPFLGFPNTNPYAGQGPLAGAAHTPAPTQVIFNVHAIDAKGVSDFFNEHGEKMAAIVASKSPSASTGLGRRMRGLVNLP